VRFPRVKPKVQKNIERDVMGSKLGRIHMERQDYDRLQTRKLKALKATKVCPPVDVAAAHML
jgi:ribosome production factor 2